MKKAIKYYIIIILSISFIGFAIAIIYDYIESNKDYEIRYCYYFNEENMDSIIGTYMLYEKKNLKTIYNLDNTNDIFLENFIWNPESGVYIPPNSKVEVIELLDEFNIAKIRFIPEKNDRPVISRNKGYIPKSNLHNTPTNSSIKAE